MQYDMVAVKTNVPWFEIILYAFMISAAWCCSSCPCTAAVPVAAA